MQDDFIFQQTTVKRSLRCHGISFSADSATVPWQFSSGYARQHVEDYCQLVERELQCGEKPQIFDAQRPMMSAADYMKSSVWFVLDPMTVIFSSPIFPRVWCFTPR